MGLVCCLGGLLHRRALLVPLACLHASSLMAQDLPTITYTTADGLPTNEIIRAVHDPGGFLWIGTTTGLARFDGKSFKVYGRNEGIDVGTGVNDLRLGESGHLWFSTNGTGVFRFDLATADPAARFKRFPVGPNRASNRVNSFALTRDGRLWAGTDAGLFVGRQDSGSFVRLHLPIPPGHSQDSLQVTAVVPQGSDLWLATGAGVYRCSQAASPPCIQALPNTATTLVVDHEGRLWTGGTDGVKVWTLENGRPAGGPDEIGGGSILHISKASDGSMLAGTRDGRALVISNGQARLLVDTETLSWTNVTEDAAGNVWLATRFGLVYLRRQGVSLFSARHGLREPHVRSIFRDTHGRVYALTVNRWLHRIDGNRLLAVRLLVPPGIERSLWARTALVDSGGDVWLGTSQGLFRYSKVRFLADHPREYHPSMVYRRADGLAGDHIAEVFEDRRGNLWVSSVPTGPEAVAVRRFQAARFERLGSSHGMPPFNQPNHLFEDGQGTLWAGLREGGVLRIRDGRATVFGVEHGLPQFVSDGLADRSGHLWLVGQGAIVRVLDPAADAIHATPVMPRLPGRTLVMEQGAADGIFVGTDDGLLAVDGPTAATHRYSSFDGLPSGPVELLVRGADGTLLLTAGRHLVRLDPSKSIRAARLLRCLISDVRLGAVPTLLAESGVERLDGLEVQPGGNNVEVEFLGLSPHIGEPLSYEYRLTQVSEEWRRTPDRQVAYAGLAAGRYRFEVRARAADGSSVSQPATVTFRVLPPWFLSWWFLTASVGVLALLAYAAHRARLARAVYAEQLRSRIATDLHDDLGASLSQIAVSSEVLRRRRGAGMTAEEADGVLERIGTTARGLVSSMNDIVWAVNPRQDSLADLVARMRRFAEDMFAQSDTEFEFLAPADGDQVRIGPAAKREILLILKESVTNIVKHAHCERAGVALGWRGRQLTLRVWDDGRGFDPDAVHQGNGIRNLRTRVAALDGRLTIVSAPGQGTEVTLAADLR